MSSWSLRELRSAWHIDVQTAIVMRGLRHDMYSKESLERRFSSLMLLGVVYSLAPKMTRAVTSRT